LIPKDSRKNGPGISVASTTGSWLPRYTVQPSSGRKRKFAAQEEKLAKIVRVGSAPENDGVFAYTFEDLFAIAKDRFGVSTRQRE
jgi:hypothetical protein